MGATGDEAPRSSKGRALPRFFALTLFAMAGVMASLALFLSIGTVLGREWLALVVVVPAAILAWSLGRIGMKLWSGRSIPRRLRVAPVDTTSPTGDEVPRSSKGGALPRFLALVLFAIVGIIAVPALLVSITGVVDRDWLAIVVAGLGAVLAWMLVRLGMLLWSGRSLPRWLIAAFAAGIVAVPVAAIAWKGDWRTALLILKMSAAVAGIASPLLSLPTKRREPAPSDDLP